MYPPVADVRSCNAPAIAGRGRSRCSDEVNGVSMLLNVDDISFAVR